jgi:hypothetical protein
MYAFIVCLSLRVRGKPDEDTIKKFSLNPDGTVPKNREKTNEAWTPLKIIVTRTEASLDEFKPTFEPINSIPSHSHILRQIVIFI